MRSAHSRLLYSPPVRTQAFLRASRRLVSPPAAAPPRRREELLYQLKMKWETVNNVYQKLPLSCDTSGKKQRKEMYEARGAGAWKRWRRSVLVAPLADGPCPCALRLAQKELAQLEKDIKMLSRPVVMVEMH